jgi:hypothetical protein
MAVKDALDEAEAKTFAARMKGKVVAFDKAVGAPKAAVAAQAPAPRKFRTGSGTGSASTSAVPQEVLDRQEFEQSTDDIPF